MRTKPKFCLLTLPITFKDSKYRASGPVAPAAGLGIISAWLIDCRRTCLLYTSITKNLQANKDMGRTFMKSSQEAIKGVKDGQYYAAVVISPTFSADLASIISDDLQRPQIKYYVNEKKNAIAPKITDKGIEAIREQVNSQFIDTVTTACLLYTSRCV